MRFAILLVALLVSGCDMRRLLLAGGGGGSFTPPDRLATFHAAIADIATAPVDIIAVGDSITLGAEATSVDARFLDTLGASLATTYSATRSILFPPVWDDPSRPFANPWSNTGTPTVNLHFGPGRIAGNLTAGKTMSYTFTGTGFDLYYAQGPSGSGFGEFSYSVDGGAPTTVDARNAVQAGSRRVQVSGLSAASHTVALAPISASVPIEGIIGYNGNETDGIHLWNGGHGSYTSEDFTDPAEPWWIDILDTVEPDLVIIELGVNDAYTEVVPVATFKANLVTLIADIRAGASNEPSIVLLAMYQALDRPTWVDYVTAMREVMVEDAGQSGSPTVTLIDLVPDFGGYVDVPAGGNIDADRIHPTDAGHTFIAGLIEAAL